MMFVSEPPVDQVPHSADGVDDHPCLGGGRRVAVEDAHLVVHEMDAVELWVEGAQRLAQRRVEGVDRAVAVGGRVQHLALDLDLDGRLGAQVLPVALLDEDGEVEQLERRDVVAAMAPDEELERRLGALEAGALGLELLDELAELARIDDTLQLMAELLRAPLGVDAAAELADHESRLVADQRRVDVLVGVADLGRGRPVDAALVGEGAGPDIRCVGVGRDVGDAGHVPSRARRAPSGRRAPGTVSRPILSPRSAQMVTMLALPQRSP